MSNTKITTIIQEVRVPHNQTVLQTWYNLVERMIEREVDMEGTIVSEEVVSEEI